VCELSREPTGLLLRVENVKRSKLDWSVRTGWRKKNAFFSNNCNFLNFQYKKLC